MSEEKRKGVDVNVGAKSERTLRGIYSELQKE
jgi:hypothetical protein